MRFPNVLIQQTDRKGRFCLIALFFFPSLAVGRAGKPEASPPPQDDSFHRPVKLAGVTSDCEAELTQTLLSNGHALRASQGESAPLRRASD